MNHNKITIINTARFNPLVLVLAIVFIIASIFIFGCSKNNSNKDEYYVKYQANSSTIYLGGKLNVILKRESNQNQTFTIDTRSPWETVIGPVKKGFIANINVSEAGNNFGHLTLQAKIYCK